MEIEAWEDSKRRYSKEEEACFIGVGGRADMMMDKKEGKYEEGDLFRKINKNEHKGKKKTT